MTNATETIYIQAEPQLYDTFLRSLTATHIVVLVLIFFLYRFFVHYFDLDEKKEETKQGHIPVPQYIKSMAELVDALAHGSAQTVQMVIDHFAPVVQEKAEVQIIPPNARELLAQEQLQKKDVEDLKEALDAMGAKHESS